MSKSAIKVLVFLILSVSLVVVGCGANQPTAQNDANASSSETSADAPSQAGTDVHLSVGGSTSGSTAFAYSVAIGNIVSKYSPEIKLQIQETSGTVEGVTLLQGQVLDIAVSTSDTTSNAINGVGPFEQLGAFEDMRMMWNMYPTPFNIVVPKNSDIQTPADLVGKKVGAGAPGSGSYIMLLDVLKAFGIDESQVNIQSMTPEQQEMAFKDGLIDAMTFQAGPGTAWLMDLSRSRELRWVELPEDIYQKMMADKPAGYYVPSEIPAQSYEGQDEPVQTVAAVVQWVTRSDVDEEAIYKIAKNFWENKSEADEMHSIIRTSTLELAFGNSQLPFHPGVIRYLEEQNIPYNH